MSYQFSDMCWSSRLNGKYIKEQHGATNECYSFEEAKEKCEAASDCHGIATQSNVCGGQYRVSHGSTATLLHYNDWASYNLWAYTLDRSCEPGKFLIMLWFQFTIATISVHCPFWNTVPFCQDNVATFMLNPLFY